MQKAYDDGLVIQTNPGTVPQLKRYIDEQRGIALSDVWTDIPPLNSQAQERLGYSTQKPRALLERIIAASSNPGDVVLDPFCGCGTAVDAAQKLGRRWIGIDVTHLAIGMIENRMRDGYPGIEFETIGVPKDLASAEKLAADDPHQFQQWVAWQVGGYPRDKKGGDKGVDGWFNYEWVGPDRDNVRSIETGVISVKAGDNVNPNMVRDLGRVMERDRHRFGLFVMKSMPTKGMRDEAASQPTIETQWGRFPSAAVRHVGRAVPGPETEGATADQSGEEGLTGGNADEPPKGRAKSPALTPILIPSAGPESWKQFLAQPDLHWATGYSARTLAHSWEAAGGIPAEVKRLLEAALGTVEPLIVIPEHKTPLPGGRHESQSDVFLLARHADGTVACTIEGKVDEPFGPTVAQQLMGASSGKAERMNYLCQRLGLSDCSGEVHYQLLHRSVSALTEAERFDANRAAMIVHSFSPDRRWFEAYARFVELLGGAAEADGAATVEVPGATLLLGWACGEQRFRAM